MSPRLRFTLLLLVIAVAAGLVIRVDRVVTRQRERLATLTTQAEQLEKQLAAELRNRDATGRDLDLARRQLAELPQPPDAANGTREADLRAWLARVVRLRELFKARPDQVIPEMRLLTDGDWLQVARRAALETTEEQRKALAAARTAAKNTFNNQIARAMGKYRRTVAGNEQPASIAALVPYFDEPVDLGMLQRYEVVPFSSPARLREPPPGMTAVNANAAWAVQEAAAIDPDYDSRYQTSSTNSMSMMAGPVAWIPNYRERITAAYKGYATANNGTQPSTFAAVAPFFDPPLDAATVEKIVKAERERNK